MHFNFLKDKAPSIFRTEDHGPAKGASDHYKFFTTLDVIKMMKRWGWEVFDANQQNSKKSPETCKHIVFFRNKNFGLTGINGSIPEIALVNSHDRTSSFVFHVGIFRSNSNNRMYVFNRTFDEFTVRHMGHDFEKTVKPLIDEITENLPRVFETISRFEKVKLGKEERIQFALEALTTRYPQYINQRTRELDQKVLLKDLDLGEYMTPNSNDEAGKDLWSTLNLVHDKIINGGFSLRQNDDKARKVRELSNIRNNLMVNKELWKMAEDKAERK